MKKLALLTLVCVALVAGVFLCLPGRDDPLVSASQRTNTHEVEDERVVPDANLPDDAPPEEILELEGLRVAEYDTPLMHRDKKRPLCRDEGAVVYGVTFTNASNQELALYSLRLSLTNTSAPSGVMFQFFHDANADGYFSGAHEEEELLNEESLEPALSTWLEGSSALEPAKPGDGHTVAPQDTFSVGVFVRNVGASEISLTMGIGDCLFSVGDNELYRAPTTTLAKATVAFAEHAPNDYSIHCDTSQWQLVRSPDVSWTQADESAQDEANPDSVSITTTIKDAKLHCLRNIHSNAQHAADVSECRSSEGGFAFAVYAKGVSQKIKDVNIQSQFDIVPGKETSAIRCFKTLCEGTTFDVRVFPIIPQNEAINRSIASSFEQTPPWILSQVEHEIPVGSYTTGQGAYTRIDPRSIFNDIKEGSSDHTNVSTALFELEQKGVIERRVKDTLLLPSACTITSKPFHGYDRRSGAAVFQYVVTPQPSDDTLLVPKLSVSQFCFDASGPGDIAIVFRKEFESAGAYYENTRRSNVGKEEGSHEYRMLGELHVPDDPNTPAKDAHLTLSGIDPMQFVYLRPFSPRSREPKDVAYLRNAQGYVIFHVNKRPISVLKMRAVEQLKLFVCFHFPDNIENQVAESFMETSVFRSNELLYQAGITLQAGSGRSPGKFASYPSTILLDGIYSEEALASDGSRKSIPERFRDVCASENLSRLNIFVVRRFSDPSKVVDIFTMPSKNTNSDATSPEARTMRSVVISLEGLNEFADDGHEALASSRIAASYALAHAIGLALGLKSKTITADRKELGSDEFSPGNWLMGRLPLPSPSYLRPTHLGLSCQTIKRAGESEAVNEVEIMRRNLKGIPRTWSFN